MNAAEQLDLVRSSFLHHAENMEARPRIQSLPGRAKVTRSAKQSAEVVLPAFPYSTLSAPIPSLEQILHTSEQHLAKNAHEMPTQETKLEMDTHLKNRVEKWCDSNAIATDPVVPTSSEEVAQHEAKDARHVQGEVTAEDSRYTHWEGGVSRTDLLHSNNADRSPGGEVETLNRLRNPKANDEHPHRSGKSKSSMLTVAAQRLKTAEEENRRIIEENKNLFSLLYGALYQNATLMLNSTEAEQRARIINEQREEWFGVVMRRHERYLDADHQLMSRRLFHFQLEVERLRRENDLASSAAHPTIVTTTAQQYLMNDLRQVLDQVRVDQKGLEINLRQIADSVNAATKVLHAPPPPPPLQSQQPPIPTAAELSQGIAMTVASTTSQLVVTSLGDRFTDLTRGIFLVQSELERYVQQQKILQAASPKEAKSSSVPPPITPELRAALDKLSSQVERVHHTMEEYHARPPRKSEETAVNRSTNSHAAGDTSGLLKEDRRFIADTMGRAMDLQLQELTENILDPIASVQRDVVEIKNSVVSLMEAKESAPNKKLPCVASPSLDMASLSTLEDRIVNRVTDSFVRQQTLLLASEAAGSKSNNAKKDAQNQQFKALSSFLVSFLDLQDERTARFLSLFEAKYQLYSFEARLLAKYIAASNGLAANVGSPPAKQPAAFGGTPNNSPPAKEKVQGAQQGKGSLATTTTSGSKAVVESYSPSVEKPFIPAVVAPRSAVPLRSAEYLKLISGVGFGGAPIEKGALPSPKGKFSITAATGTSSSAFEIEDDDATTEDRQHTQQTAAVARSLPTFLVPPPNRLTHDASPPNGSGSSTRKLTVPPTAALKEDDEASSLSLDDEFTPPKNKKKTVNSNNAHALNNSGSLSFSEANPAGKQKTAQQQRSMLREPSPPLVGSSRRSSLRSPTPVAPTEPPIKDNKRRSSFDEEEEKKSAKKSQAQSKPATTTAPLNPSNLEAIAKPSNPKSDISPQFSIATVSPLTPQAATVPTSSLAPKAKVKTPIAVAAPSAKNGTEHLQTYVFPRSETTSPVGEEPHNFIHVDSSAGGSLSKNRNWGGILSPKSTEEKSNAAKKKKQLPNW